MPHKTLCEDSNIAVQLLEFDPLRGVATIKIDEKVPKVGFYYIFIYFESGNNHRIDYDGANPNCKVAYQITTNKRNDTIQKVEAKRVRD